MTQEIYDRVVRDGRRRRARFLGGASVVVAGLVTAGVVVLPTGDGATDRLVAVDAGPPTASPADCPATAERAPDYYEPAAVPALPEGFDGAAALLPEGVPSSVVVCRYQEALPAAQDESSPSGPRFLPAPLVGGRAVSGDLGALAVVLTTPPPETEGQCGDALGRATPVRVRVTYPSGARAWLSTEDNTYECTGISNGMFVNQIDLGAQLLDAWENGAWEPPTPETVALVSADDCPLGAAALPPGPDAVLPVPALPEGFDASARLVPEEIPAAVLVCRYERIPFGSDAVGALVKGTPVTGDLADLGRVLGVPLRGDFGPCRLAGNSPEPLRVLVRYLSGANAWLTTETDVNGCTGIGNGAVVSSTYLAGDLLAAGERGRWEPVQPQSPCEVPDAGRPGQDLALVPAGFASVAVCRGQEYVDVNDPAAVVGLLGSAESELDDGFSGSCSGPTGEPSRTELLRITYPTGRSVVVSVWAGCTPAWQNGSVAGLPTQQQQDRLLRLLDG